MRIAGSSISGGGIGAVLHGDKDSR
jgi:hypothetical protein